MERRKTQAERELERAEAVQRLEQQRAGSGERPCSITAADIPDQIARPKASKTFVVVGISIIVLLVLAHLFLAISKSKQAKPSAISEPARAVEME